MIVKFKDAGRGKRCWEEEISEPLTDTKIVAAVRRKGSLASRGIDVDLYESGDGAVFVGGFRCVGTFQVVQP